MEDIFSRTMSACLESKKTVSTTQSKKIVESDKKVVNNVQTKKTVIKESAAPAVKSPIVTKEAPKKSVYEKKHNMFEAEDDFDEEMNELDNYDDEAEDENEVDMVDDIVVVVDPELDEQEITQTAGKAQEIVDNTEDGEVPSTDEYVGDLTYTCPVCGNTFFSDGELSEGDTCPVCGEVPDGFVLVGEVQTAEDAGLKDDTEEEEIVDGDEDLIADVDLDDEVEERKENKMVRRPVRKVRPLNLDESTFNPFLTKFIRENYKNAKSFVIENASVNRKSGRLVFECKITFKSGNTKKVNLKAENYRSGKCILKVRDDGAFKIESKKSAPILMSVSTNNNVIKCEGMKYDFITVVEGKRARVTSIPVMESRKPVVKKTVRR